MKEVEGFFAKFKGGPFEDPFAGELAATPANPFSHLSPGRYSCSGDEVENNGVRHAVLGAAVENLPDDPTRFFGALQQLRTDMDGGDSAWQRGVEAGLIRLKSGQWSAEACLAAAGLWAAELDGKRDEPTFKQLAARAVHMNPEQVSAALDPLPESARGAFAGELIKQLPATEPDSRIDLFSDLTVAQWDDDLGKSLGGNAVAFAPASAALPAATTLGARNAFMQLWGEQDPEAAARWLDSLPNMDAAFDADRAQTGVCGGGGAIMYAIEWAGEAPEAMFAWLLQQSGSSYERCLSPAHILFDTWAERDMTAALAAVATISERSLRQQALLSSLEILCKSDPGRARNLLLENLQFFPADGPSPFFYCYGVGVATCDMLLSLPAGAERWQTC